MLNKNSFKIEIWLGLFIVFLLVAGISILNLSTTQEMDNNEIINGEDVLSLSKDELLDKTTQSTGTNNILQNNGQTQTQAPIIKPAKPSFPQFKEIVNPAGFVNADNITIGEFIGKKIVLIDFLTYSCINCQRTFPYINAWHDKYNNEGLQIIGIHTPEFAIEKNSEHVREAMQKYGIKHPIVLDNTYSTWNAYGNNYWPRKYLIDINGNIVYDHIGEGAYAQTEMKIQELLRERQTKIGSNSSVSNINKTLTPIDPQISLAKSPEIYFGAFRNSDFQNGTKNKTGIQSLSAPQNSDLIKNKLYLNGEWNIENEYSENNSAGAKILFKYEAKDVFFVAGAESDIKIKILKDGALIDTQTIKNHTLYHLIKDATGGVHTLEIIIESPGLRAYTFTFG